MESEEKGKSKGVYLRGGTWSDEEMEFMLAMVKEFRAGSVPIKKGTTMRSYLAGQLRCIPKRISKKMENSDYNGRLLYEPAVHFSGKELKERRERLEKLRLKFEDAVVFLQNKDDRSSRGSQFFLYEEKPKPVIKDIPSSPSSSKQSQEQATDDKTTKQATVGIKGATDGIKGASRSIERAIASAVLPQDPFRDPFIPASRDPLLPVPRASMIANARLSSVPVWPQYLPATSNDPLASMIHLAQPWANPYNSMLSMQRSRMLAQGLPLEAGASIGQCATSGEGQLQVPDAAHSAVPDTTVPDTTVPDTTVPDTTEDLATVLARNIKSKEWHRADATDDLATVLARNLKSREGQRSSLDPPAPKRQRRESRRG
ncbi:expressed unknown protein [Seminavis robusta]|uniref:Uncharacterized protein n=1 Tax=Seminavis robusta TaxID=568900 RepID=A0A9N8EHW5_9STRA|nr:expressed unknown protein [Seminavis robusta]|eukprot:Sro1245_g255690.1 n/a (372) ;mRNA; f:16939-18054